MKMSIKDMPQMALNVSIGQAIKLGFFLGIGSWFAHEAAGLVGFALNMIQFAFLR